MKKVISLVLVLALVFSFFPAALAADQPTAKIDLKKAIEIAKDKLKLSTDGFDFNSEYSEGIDGKKAWHLSWSSKSGVGKEMSVTIDADTGEVVNFYSYYPYTERPKIPKYSKEQALKTANDFINRLLPEKFKDFKLKESKWEENRDYNLFSDTYSFTYVRYVNGVPFLNNTISISVDKNTLSVRNYSFDWEDKPFTDVKKAMSPEDAQKAFKDKLGVELSYSLIYSGYDQTPKPILVYSFKNGNKPIDAVTGEVIEYSDYGIYYSRDSKGLANTAKQESLSPQENKAVEDTSKLVSKEKATEELNKYLKLNDNYTLSSSNLYTGYPKGSNPVWSFSWNYQEDKADSYGYANGSVDAVTGQVKSFSISGSDYEPAKDAVRKYTKETAKPIAEEFLKKIQPEKFSLTEYRDNETKDDIEQQSTYNFNYIRKIDGIVCPSNSLSVSVSAYTGNISSFNVEWYNLDFPKADNVIGLDKAYSSVFNNLDFSLKYIKQQDYYRSDIKKPDANGDIKLVYMPDTISNLIDAKTGNLLDNSGNVIKPANAASFTDIKGHWAENDISLLVELGVLEPENSLFKPKDNITQKDFIKLLMCSIDPGYKNLPDTANKDDKYYEQAIQKKIIFPKEKSPDKNVSRLDGAKFIIRALNLGYIADIKGLYSQKFADFKPGVKSPDYKYLGYVSLADGLKIITSSNNRFYPDKSISRAEAAVILVRFLKNDTANKE